MISKHTSERRSVSRRRELRRTTDFSEGGQIARLICEHFRPAGSYAFKDYRDCSVIELENDDIQDFDLHWEQALLLTRDRASDKVLEGLYVSKLQDSFKKFKKFFDEEDNDYHRARMCVKLYTEQLQRSKHFRIQSEITERAAVIEGPSGLHTTTRELQTCTLERPGASNTTKIPRENPREGRKERIFTAGEEQKSAKFWAPHTSEPHTSVPHTSGPHPSGPHPSKGPHPERPPPFGASQFGAPPSVA